MNDMYRDASGASEHARAVKPTLICFSHLRWSFVFQRPQHLMTRFAKTYHVIYWEEPVLRPGIAPLLDIRTCDQTGVTIATPQLPEAMSEAQQVVALRRLLDTMVGMGEGQLLRWYYTPMMLPFSRHLTAATVIYDCMDELSVFNFAPQSLIQRETELLEDATLVFTGGRSLFEAKRNRHPQVHCFPSGVDQAHFASARTCTQTPADQARIAGPRIGYFGVIDERIDLPLIAGIARSRPDLQLVMVGPVVKIETDTLPQLPNIHWLGAKSYDELPAYLAGWDVALMPFAINEATRYISPTKTPEYLAGGKPIVSTPVADVVASYGTCQRVLIADGLEPFIGCIAAAQELAVSGNGLADADLQVAASSWDRVFAEMAVLVAQTTKPVGLQRNAGAKFSWNLAPGKPYDWLIVGAGFAGAVMAERLAAGSGARVLVVDRRAHIGGNAYDERNEIGQLVHKYGPHLFHTNSAEVFDYLSRFTDWRPYEHRVLADIDGVLVPVPINRTTVNRLYGLDLQNDDDAAAWFAGRAEPVDCIKTSEDVVVSAIGRELYEKFFRGYTRKQWGLDPSELDKSVTARVPTRTNTDDRYFSDAFQAIPANGYTRMFERMLDHPNIDVLLDVDFTDIRKVCPHDRLVFTGPIDEYFGFCFGALPYRSLRFEHAVVDCEQFQPVATVNYPNEATPYTRITEYKHFTGDVGPQTSITTEYPAAEGDPYYPIPRETNQRLYKRYEALADAEPETLFVGRLATYRYYNMDQVVGQALATWRKSHVALSKSSNQQLAPS